MISIRRLTPGTWTEIESASTVAPDYLFSKVATILSNSTKTWRGCWHFNSTTKRAQREFNGNPELVYRTIFMAFNDCIWPDPTCRHLCGAARCINYEHLWPGDTEDQTLDSEFHEKHPDWTAPRDWYSDGARETMSVATMFDTFLTGDGWGEDYWYYLEKYNIFELIDQLNNGLTSDSTL